MKRFHLLKTKLIGSALLSAASTAALAADELDVVSGASDYIVKYLIGLAIIILPLQTIFQILQVKFGKKDIGEAMVPIGWTTLIVATPAIIAAIISIIQPYLGANVL